MSRDHHRERSYDSGYRRDDSRDRRGDYNDRRNTGDGNFRHPSDGGFQRPHGGRDDRGSYGHDRSRSESRERRSYSRDDYQQRGDFNPRGGGYQPRGDFQNRGRGRGGYGGFGNRGNDNGSFVDRNVPMPSTIPAPNTQISSEQGTSGQKIEVITNNFLLTVDDLLVYQYRVDIEFNRHDKGNSASGDSAQPAIDPIKEQRAALAIKKFSPQVIGRFLQDNGFGKLPYAFDNANTIFFQTEINHNVLEGNVNLEGNGRDHSFKVKIAKVTHLSLGSVSRYYEGEKEAVPDALKQLFDIVFRDVAAQHFSGFQGSFFDRNTASSKQGIDEIEFVNGFKACVRQTLSGFVLNVHLKTAAVLSSRFTTLHQLFEMDSRNGNDREMKALNSLIKHLEVLCNHGKPRTYKIDKIVQKTPSQIFIGDDKNMTMVDYFKKKYNLDINPRYPVVKVQMRNDTFLPIELCTLPVHQFINHRKINPAMQREILMRSTNAPNVYFSKVDRFVKALAEETEKLSQFGLKMNPKPLSLQARVLPAPRNNGDQRNQPFIKAAKFTKYSIFCLDEDIPSRQLESFCRQFEDSARRVGMRLEYGTQKISTISRPEDLVGMCQKIKERLDDQIILVAIPKHNPGLAPHQIYDCVKFLSERANSFTTQCLKSEVIRNLPRGYFDNFLLKVNGKFDGTNQQLERDAFDGFGFDPATTMVIAYDVNHPGQREVTKESIVAVVGSTDPMFTKYHSSMARQTSGHTELANIGGDVEIHLKAYQKVIGHYPETLVVFRDGISSGMFARCKEIEIEAINQALVNLGLTRVKVVYIVAQKKHGVRFALLEQVTHPGQRNPSYNVPSGTVVDTAVVSANTPNFFLTSHNSPLGTARNVHYYILRNDAKMTMDQIQNFTFRCCFNSVRSKNVSSIPLALRYVDHLARRGKQYSEAHVILGRDLAQIETHAIGSGISNTLFYL